MKLNKAQIGAVLASLAVFAVTLTACNEKATDKTSGSAFGTTVETVAAASAESAAPAESAASAETTVSTPVAAGGVVLADGVAPAERTVTVSKTGFSPAALTIKVGEQVTFTAPDGIFAVLVGDLSGATVTKGLFETFTFSAPGTYPVKEDLTGSTAMITVE